TFIVMTDDICSQRWADLPPPETSWLHIPFQVTGVLITRRRSSQINGTLVPTEAGCGHPKALLSDHLGALVVAEATCSHPKALLSGHLWSIGGRRSDI
ncbi:hypothetical protein, partial [Escherichia coli]|uniref:hypothetical protein n=1 Tax=Escherichia coli TaxID=562 RepID=UPI000E214B19